MTKDKELARIMSRHEAKTSRRERVRQLAKTLNTTAHGVMETLDEITTLEEALAAYKIDVVDAARYNGESWTKIGQQIGMTKQAAQQRYGKKPTGPAPDGPHADVPLPLH